MTVQRFWLNDEVFYPIEYLKIEKWQNTIGLKLWTDVQIVGMTVKEKLFK